MATPDWLNFQNIKDVVIGLVAIYGAGPSTFNWRQGALCDRRNLKVSFRIDQSKYTFEGTATLVVTNIGHCVVVVSSAFLELDDGERLLISDHRYKEGPIKSTELPCTLSDG